MFRPLSHAAIVAAVFLATWSAPGYAQDAADKAALELDSKIIADAAKTSEIMKNLSYMSDVIGPRLTGSANLKRANEWAAEVMKKYGLQNVKLEPWEIPVGWERGTATMKLIDPDNGRSLTVCSAGWTGGTKGNEPVARTSSSQASTSPPEVVAVRADSSTAMTRSPVTSRMWPSSHIDVGSRVRSVAASASLVLSATRS